MGAATGLFLLLLSSFAQWNPWNEGQEPANIRSHLSQEPSSPGHHPSFHQFPSWDIPIMGASEEEFECPTSSGRFPYPGDCSKYYQCFNKKPTVKSCPSGLKFDKHLGCTLPQLADCDDDAPEFECPERYGNFPIPANCQKYATCIAGKATIRTCPSGMEFDSKFGCVLKGTGDCNKEHSSLNQQIFEEFRCPGVSGEYPDPFDCNRYFLCVASRPTHKACNSHEMYIQGRGCVLENVEVCPIISSSASEELSEETEGLQSSFEHATADFTCPSSDGIFPYESDCRKYYFCFQDKATLKECGYDTEFKTGYGCIEKGKGDCVSDVRMPESFSALHSKEVDRNFRCPKNSGQFPYIRDCSKYYKCMNGIVNLMSCPHGALFNTETSSCNPPRNVTCPPYESDKKVICYFSNERDHSSTHTLYPGDLNPYLCTHIHYSNAILDPRSLKIAIGNHQVDIIEQAYRRVTALRKLNPELKVLLTIGSSDSNTDEFSLMAADPQKRQTFIQHLISFLREHGFDGLEMDWEYPVCKTPLCSLSERGNLRDKENFALLIKEIRHAFDREQTPLLLAVKVSGSKTVIDLAYDVPTISRHSNYLVVMAFIPDGYTPSRMARHPGRMNPNPNVPHDTENVDFIMNYWRQKGAAPKKMILGIRAIGKGYILTDEQQNEVDSPITGMGHPENIPFPKVCQRIKQSSWTTMRDSDAGPYAYNRKHWMAYDDPKSVAEKTKYVIDNGYGGVMFCAAAHDDFAGECCKVKYPLLKGALYALTRKGMTPEMFECEG